MQGTVLGDDGGGHLVEGSGQITDFGRRALGLQGSDGEAAAGIDRGDALQVADPADHSPVGGVDHRAQGQEEGQQRRQQPRNRVQPRPGEQALGGGRQHNEYIVADQRSGRDRPQMAQAVAPGPDHPAGLDRLGDQGLGRDGKDVGIGQGDIGALGVDEAGFGPIGKRAVTGVGLQARQRHHRREGAVELSLLVLGPNGGDHRRLVGIGDAGRAAGGEVIARGQGREPRPGGPQGVGRHTGGGARDAAVAVEADQILIARQTFGDIAKPRGALQPHRARPEGLQQHAGRLDPSMGSGRRTEGGQAQAFAPRLGVVSEGPDGLRRADGQHRQQGHRQHRGQPDTNGRVGGPGRPDRKFQRTVLRRSASARMANIASPAPPPSLA